MSGQEAGHEIKIINLMEQEDVFKALGVSISEFEPVKSMITFCRDHTDSTIVIGGAGYSIFPQNALEYLEADMGIQGEGEESFLLLLERLRNKSDLAGIRERITPNSSKYEQEILS